MTKPLTTVRASSLNIGYHCTGAPKLMRDTPIERDDLSEGTLVHEWISSFIVHNKHPGRSYEHYDFIMPILRWIGELGAKDLYCGSKHAYVEANLKSETLFLSGHPDLFIVNDEECQVWDWKHGEGQKWILPQVDHNLQLIAYACMIEERFRTSTRFQLNIARTSDREIDRCDFDDISAAQDLIKIIVEDILFNQDVRTPGIHCDHCLVRNHCPEWLEQNTTVVSLLARPLDTLTQEQASRWALARGSARAAVEAADKALREYIKQGGIVEHDGKRLKLTTTSKERVADIDKVLSVCHSYMGEATNKIVEIQRKTSKKRIKGLLRNLGMKGKEIDAVMDELREAGAISTYETDGTLRWGKGK